MAVKKLPGQEEKTKTEKTKDEDVEKPNINDFIRTEKPADGTAFVIEKCKLTLSGWLIVETTDWVGFIHAKTAVVKTLMQEIAPAGHGKQGNQLVALIGKKSKFKFVLATDDEIKMWYSFDPEANLLTMSVEQDEAFLLPTGALKLEDFMFT